MQSDSLDLFKTWMRHTLALDVRAAPPERAGEHELVVGALAEVLEAGRSPWTSLPEIVQRVFAPRGWAWNGIYVLRDGRLELASAAGPPVCHTIERTGGVGTSGMCFDALLMNQTLVAADVKRWPGYVSCDGESGLETRSGMVCPIRGAGAAPLAVWDLDATQELELEDPPFFDRLFATLSALLEPAPDDFDRAA